MKILAAVIITAAIWASASVLAFGAGAPLHPATVILGCFFTVTILILRIRK